MRNPELERALEQFAIARRRLRLALGELFKAMWDLRYFLVAIAILGFALGYVMGWIANVIPR